MARFIVKFLLIALLLGTAVWYGLPRVYAALNSKGTRIVIVEGKAPPPKKTIAKSTENGSTVSQPVENGTPEPETATPEDLPTILNPLQPSESVLEEENAQRASDPDYPTIARKGDPPMWGVTALLTEAANLNGEKLVPVPGGIPVKIFTEKTIGDRRYMICQFVTPPRAAPTGKILIPRAALAVYTGDHTRLPERDLQKLTDFFALTARINKRAEDLQSALLNQNPHGANYTRLYEEYQKIIADQKRLTDASKKADNGMMVRISDKLRELNARGRIVQEELKTLQPKYIGWFKANPQTDRTASWAGDPEIAAMIPKWQQKNLGIERLTAVSAATLYLERRLPALPQAAGL